MTAARPSDAREESNPAWWFWIISGLALVWNFIGLTIFVGRFTIGFEQTPIFVVAAFAVAVFGGVIGCIALLIRKEWAINVLMMSLAGVLTQMSHAFFVSGAFQGQETSTLVMPVCIILIAVLLIPFSAASRKRGWLRSND
ncbi:MAG: hypothetical protein ACI9HK_003685 [Pirellulaceae bacterium]|jgi:hypothetical protein